ncbi:MAG: hypothetical protein AAGA33_09135 [Pseudomonadota bacterium]
MQALIPVGYMPANLAGGSPVKFCPSGLPDAVIAVIYGQHHHHHHSNDIDFERCEVAGGPALAVLSGTTEHAVPRLAPAPLTGQDLSARLANTQVFNYRPRAPPSPGNA